MKLNRIPYKNFIKRPGRSAALCLLSLLLSFAVLGGSLVILGLRSGLDSLETRLGADIMVVPYEATSKSQLTDMVLSGNPGYFYMNRSVLDKLSGMEGVGQISEQCYLASASTSCCSMAVQLIGYDPETDFTISPWVQRSYKGELADGQVLVGNSLNLFAGDSVTFYDVPLAVAAKLDKTGTYLDTSVYMNEETLKNLIASAKEKQINLLSDVDPDRVVSSVLINVADGYPVEEVLGDIKIHVRKVDAVRTQDMLSDVASQMSGISGVIAALIAALWILALVILCLAYSMIANERRKEFAIIRIAGASRRRLAGLVMQETLFSNIIGSLIGSAAALAAAYLFAQLIESSLGLPFLLPGAAGVIAITLATLIVSLLAGTLSSALCALRISRIDPALILRADH